MNARLSRRNSAYGFLLVITLAGAVIIHLSTKARPASEETSSVPRRDALPSQNGGSAVPMQDVLGKPGPESFPLEAPERKRAKVEAEPAPRRELVRHPTLGVLVKLTYASGTVLYEPRSYQDGEDGAVGQYP